MTKLALVSGSIIYVMWETGSHTEGQNLPSLEYIHNWPGQLRVCLQTLFEDKTKRRLSCSSAAEKLPSVFNSQDYKTKLIN